MVEGMVTTSTKMAMLTLVMTHPSDRSMMAAWFILGIHSTQLHLTTIS